MKLRVTNTILLKSLVKSLGNKGEAQLEIGADISRTTVREILRGACPSPKIREKVAAFFDKDENELFPLTDMREEAA